MSSYLYVRGSCLCEFLTGIHCAKRFCITIDWASPWHFFRCERQRQKYYQRTCPHTLLMYRSRKIYTYSYVLLQKYVKKTHVYLPTKSGKKLLFTSLNCALCIGATFIYERRFIPEDYELLFRESLRR